MSRQTRLLLSLPAGLVAGVCEYFGSSLGDFLSLIVCLIAWRLLIPNGIYFPPPLRYYRTFFLIATGAFVLASPSLPLEPRELFRDAWIVSFLILVVIYAYAGWRED